MILDAWRTKRNNISLVYKKNIRPAVAFKSGADTLRRGKKDV